jgi:purine nucleoside permease
VQKRGGLPAYLPALTAAYRIGSPVVEEIVAHRDKYAGTMPTKP